MTLLTPGDPRVDPRIIVVPRVPTCKCATCTILQSNIVPPAGQVRSGEPRGLFWEDEKKRRVDP